MLVPWRYNLINLIEANSLLCRLVSFSPSSNSFLSRQCSSIYTRDMSACISLRLTKIALRDYKITLFSLSRRAHSIRACFPIFFFLFPISIKRQKAEVSVVSGIFLAFPPLFFIPCCNGYRQTDKLISSGIFAFLFSLEVIIVFSPDLAPAVSPYP